MHRWGNKKDMVGDDPPYLSVGTEVSAKYKGAFCEAKVRKVVKSVKCKVQYKNEQGSVFVNDEQIKGLLMAGASVEVKVPDKKETIEGTIVKIQDLSQYTVVFDDGDIATLRRTALCLKSGRHFAESETLDQLPLTHPEHFSTPVVSGSRGSRRRDDMDENSDDDEKQPKIEREEDMGKVVCVEIGDKKKSKDNWFPGLVVAPNAQDSVKIDVEDEYLVRSFKDGRYYTVPKNETTDFTREMGLKVENITLKQAVEKTISFIDKNELPPHWDREQLFRQGESSIDSEESDSDSMDDEPREEKDHFVAQLYKFMDDRGTPINRGPVIASKDVDLYRFFKIVYKSGGYNRVTNRSQWKAITLKLGFTISQTNNIKAAYKKYLHSFEDFYRKLGCTLLTRTDNKLRNRSSRPLIRDRDKSASDKTILDKDESSSSNCEDTVELKENANLKVRLTEFPIAEDSNTSRSSLEVKKESNLKVKTRDPSTESIKEKKSEMNTNTSNTTKDAAAVQSNIKDTKEEKPSAEKRTERKSVKLTPKMEEFIEKKSDKSMLAKANKNSNKKTKPVEKRIKKTENVLTQMKEKRSLKERMKAIVHKLKLKTCNSNDQEKKKQKPTEEVNKLLSQGLRINLKDELVSSNVKSRKLSIGSNDGKVTSSGPSVDKKVVSTTTALANNVTESSSSNPPISKIKKNEDEGNENFKRKSNTRRKKEDEKQSSSSSESQMYEAVEFVPHYKTVCIGDKLKVYYEPTHESKVTYEAKVTNKRYGAVTEYLVHYTGWNTRYDEWIRRSRIADNLSWTPARAKRRSNQLDTSPAGNQITVPEKTEIQPPPNQNIVKLDKNKRASQSPVAKNRSKLSIKSGVKQIKNMKNKLESKSKKLAAQKADSNNSDSEDENNQKQELQKTRSRTEKQKQQEEESSTSRDSEKDTEVKKKVTPMKRTRSGSIKLEKKDITKKRKLSPSTAKGNKGNSVRNSIMKTLVPRKRASARSKELKDDKDKSEKSSLNEVEDNDREKNNETMEEDVKPSVDNLEKNIGTLGNVGQDFDDKSLISKISPSTSENSNVDVDISDESVSNANAEDDKPLTVTSNEESGPPPLKRETIDEDEVTIPRVLAVQSFTDSYLAENLDVKPKIIKTKLKKEPEERSATSPSKIIARSSCEKTPTKSVGEIKEKTIFTSRSPSEKKSEKTPEKDGKLKNVSTYTSYLNMDKIDFMKKNIAAEKSDKSEKSAVVTKTVDSMSTKSVDDIYEFNEPEPVAIDDRAMLHRRSTPRIFEDNTKRTKIVNSTVDSFKEVEESCKLSEDMNIVETKSIPTKKSASESEHHVSVDDEEKEIKTAKSNADDSETCTSDKETIEEDLLKGGVGVESVKSAILKSGTVDYRVRDSLDTGVERSTSTNSDKSDNDDDDDDNDDDDDDADESKLVISEGDATVEFEDEEVDKEVVVDEISAVNSCSSGSDLKSENKMTQLESNVVGKEKEEMAEESEEKKLSDDSELQDDQCDDRVTNKVDLEGKSKKITKKRSHSEDRVDRSLDVENRVRSSSQGSVAHNSVAKEAGAKVFVLSEEGKTSSNDESDRNAKCKDEEMDVEDYSKTKYEEEVSDGLLLCEETIPKSPESKDVNEMEVDYPCASRNSQKENKKPVDAQIEKVKKESRANSFVTPSDTPPTTPEGSNSTPGTSPSEEVSGFSSATFSLNEKSGSNKDSSENETSSDTSEKPAKIKKYSNEAYAKKNAFEFDTYLKEKAEDDTDEKLEDASKKKSKPSDAPANDADKEDSNDVGSCAQKEKEPSKPKSSIAYILAQIPLDFDSNQRIEFLEQKQEEIRKRYMNLKQEVAVIDKKRKKLRRKQREGRMMTRNEANSLLA